jgi:hypothetical protein
VNQDFILGRLGEIMSWETERARQEFAWLRLMSRMKYDGYQDFLAGVRFIECLADWLQQFKLEDREAAYGFVRRTLVYVSTAEMNHLVDLFYPETVQWQLQNAVASLLRIPPYRVWATRDSAELFRRLRRQTLFIELSDGARIDVFRRANAGTISTEQVLTAPRINDEKWNELLEKLRKDVNDKDARFAFVFLIDDFVGSGKTLIDGKIPRFVREVEKFFSTHFEASWKLCVHHYLATDRARVAIEEHQAKIRAETRPAGWFEDILFSFSMVFPADLPLEETRHADFLKLTKCYYDPAIETEHTGKDIWLGYKQGALPLILEHNTPNNSVALLWAESAGEAGKHAMRPLFRRRQRHLW